MTALYIAVKEGHNEIAQALLRAGADPAIMCQV
jgi:ankyrin repeat protein